MIVSRALMALRRWISLPLTLIFTIGSVDCVNDTLLFGGQ
jgi:hypothetical protein